MKLPFLSTYPGSLDDKCRLSIPADFRIALSPESDNYLVFVRGAKQFLYAFPMDYYKTLVGQAHRSRRELGSLDTLARNTVLYGDAFHRQLDQQGRITLPADVLKEAGIGKEITFMGSFEYFLVWDKAGYATHRGGIKLQPGDAWAGDDAPLHDPTN